MSMDTLLDYNQAKFVLLHFHKHAVKFWVVIGWTAHLCKMLMRPINQAAFAAMAPFSTQKPVHIDIIGKALIIDFICAQK